VRVALDFSRTDFPPACWVVLAFLHASPSRTLTFARFVGFAGITTVSQSPYGVCSPRVLSSFFSYPIPEQYAIFLSISQPLNEYLTILVRPYLYFLYPMMTEGDQFIWDPGCLNPASIFPTNQQTL